MKNISLKRTLMEFNDHLNKKKQKTEAHCFIGNKATKQLKAEDHTNSATKMKMHWQVLHQCCSTGTARIKMNFEQ